MSNRTFEVLLLIIFGFGLFALLLAVLHVANGREFQAFDPRAAPRLRSIVPA